MAAVRAPHLYRSLRCFCLGAFHVLAAEDVDLPFAFEQHVSHGRPILYEYRPLVRDFVEARARKLESRQDAQLAVQDLRATDQARELGDALLDQRLVAGIGNMWKAEALWEVKLSPWARLRELSDDELRGAVDAAARLMRGGVETGRPGRNIYRRNVCPRCGGRISSRGQGDDNRTTYWCPVCQAGKVTPSA